MKISKYSKMKMLQNYERKLENETNLDKIELYKSIICNLEKDLRDN